MKPEIETQPGQPQHTQEPQQPPSATESQKLPHTEQKNSTWKNIGLVAQREFKVRMWTKANILSMAFIVVVIVSGVFLGNYLLNSSKDAPADVLGVSDAQLAPALKQVASGTKPVRVVPMDRATAEDIILEKTDASPVLGEGSGELVAYLDTSNPAAPELVARNNPGLVLTQTLTMSLQQLTIGTEITKLGGDPAALAMKIQSTTPKLVSLENIDDWGTSYLVSIVALMLLMMALVMSGQIILMGVVEEKSSRIVEILLATVRPFELLAGKIAGAGIVALITLAIEVGVGMAAVAYTGVLDDYKVNVNATLLSLLVWFVLGFFTYAALFAAAGALVSRQEDAASAVAPLTIIMLVGLYAAIFVNMNSPDGTAAVILTQIPFLAPFMVPVRIGYGAITALEMISAAGITILFIPVIIWVAAKVYKRGILHTGGGRMKLKEAFGRAKV